MDMACAIIVVASITIASVHIHGHGFAKRVLEHIVHATILLQDDNDCEFEAM